VLLLLGLLGGSLVCLLVVNTTLAANSIRIGDLQQANVNGGQRIAELQQQVAAERSPAVIAREARLLHMRPDGSLRVLSVRAGVSAPRGASTRVAAGPRVAPGHRR
jgi:hypothetical protein